MNKTALDLIVEERQRQKEIEGWTPEHDNEHTDGSLATVAACYAVAETLREDFDTNDIMPDFWPESWDESWWKPSPDNRIKELAKAGALILAEIERLQRMA